MKLQEEKTKAAQGRKNKKGGKKDMEEVGDDQRCFEIDNGGKLFVSMRINHIISEKENQLQEL